VSKYLGKLSQNIQNSCRIPHFFFKKERKRKKPAESCWEFVYLHVSDSGYL